jgi:hypothetical protein
LRSFKQFATDIVRNPPMLFPLVGVFHIFWLLLTVWSDRHEPFPGIVWLEVLWMAGYTIFWIAVCDLRKWGANGYIFLTLLNASLYLAIRSGKLSRDYLSNMFLLDGLFSVFLVFYYKRFRSANG